MPRGPTPRWQPTPLPAIFTHRLLGGITWSGARDVDVIVVGLADGALHLEPMQMGAEGREGS